MQTSKANSHLGEDKEEEVVVVFVVRNVLAERLLHVAHHGKLLRGDERREQHSDSLIPMNQTSDESIN